MIRSLDMAGVVDRLMPSVAWVWLVFLIILLLFAAVSGIFMFHWKSYAFDQQKVRFVRNIYFFVSIILILSMFLSLLFYS